KAVAWDAKNPDFWLALAAAYYRSGQWEDAGEALLKAEKRPPLSPGTSNSFHIGSPGAARRFLDSMVDLQSRNRKPVLFVREGGGGPEMAFTRLENENWARGQYKDGVRWMETHNPNDLEAARLRAEVDAMLGARTHYNLGLVLCNKGRFDEAIAEF